MAFPSVHLILHSQVISCTICNVTSLKRNFFTYHLFFTLSASGFENLSLQAKHSDFKFSSLVNLSRFFTSESSPKTTESIAIKIDSSRLESSLKAYGRNFMAIENMCFCRKLVTMVSEKKVIGEHAVFKQIRLFSENFSICHRSQI